jgi:hypothetical protein
VEVTAIATDIRKRAFAIVMASSGAKHTRCS